MTDEKYEGYMDRLDQEYRDFSMGLCKLSPQEIFEWVDEIQAVKLACEYLRSRDISHEELEYVMGAMHPLQEIAGQHEAFRSALAQENTVAQTVYDIWDKRLFSDGDTKLFTDRVPIRFHRKMSSISEILSLLRNREDEPFQINKVINLSPKDFTAYSNMLISDQPFITENQDLMISSGTEEWPCILVQDKANHRGILIHSEGYDYARYCAYVENTRELSLQNIPTEDYARKQRSRGRKPKQPER